MAQETIRGPQGTVERNILLTGKIMQFLMENPAVLSSLPDVFELVVLPDDDPEIRQYNLKLIDKHGNEGRPMVFVRLKAHHERSKTPEKPSFFVPLQVAA